MALEQLQQLKPKRENLLPDGIAGLTVALVNIPNGMAYALVAGVSPIYGLYSGIVTPIVAALFAGSIFMVVTLTNETALMTFSTIDSLNLQRGQIEVVFMLVLMTGLWQIIFTILKFGRLLRFISESVMTGFITGTAVLVILGQLGDLVGYSSEASNKVIAAVDILLTPTAWDLQTLIVGLSTIAVILLLNRTRLRKVTLILALGYSTILVLLTGWESVEVVGDIASIPRELPDFTLPDFSYFVPLLIPSLAMAVLSMAVASGVAKSFPNPDGKLPEANQNVLGLGAGNTAGAFFQSLPATGSLSRTATVVSGGGKSRWANIFAGLLVALVVVTVAPLAELIPMAGLAGLLIVSTIEAVNARRLVRTWEVGTTAWLAAGITFLLTLTISIQTALFGGILISFALYLYSASLDIQIRELMPMGDGRFKVAELPDPFPSGRPVVLTFYGSSFFAAIDTMDRQLPDADSLQDTVIIFTANGRQAANNTFLTWIERYAGELSAAGNLLMVAEIEPTIKDQMAAIGLLELIGERNIFLEQQILGASIEEALGAANDWLEAKGKAGEIEVTGR
jgi:SulP family sulfate permease